MKAHFPRQLRAPHVLQANIARAAIDAELLEQSNERLARGVRIHGRCREQRAAHVVESHTLRVVQFSNRAFNVATNWLLRSKIHCPVQSPWKGVSVRTPPKFWFSRLCTSVTDEVRKYLFFEAYAAAIHG